MIEIIGLTKQYGNVKALNDITFTVGKGQIVGFLGANGAGKTTTMDIVSGCIGSDAGVAKVAGFDITEYPLEAKKRLGYLPDVPPLYPEMRVTDFVSYAASLRGVDSSKKNKRVDEVLDKLALGEVRNRLVGNLSKGYRQRVGLAQALVHDPEVLILDEPTEGLDPAQIAQIRSLIRSLAGQHTILLSSHILSEVQNTCDHIVIIHKGRIVQQGTYDELAGQIGAGKSYRLKVANARDKLLEELGTIEGLHQPSLRPTADGSWVEFAISSSSNDSVLDDVARKVVNGGYGLRELSLKTKSLEEVFFQLTK